VVLGGPVYGQPSRSRRGSRDMIRHDGLVDRPSVDSAAWIMDSDESLDETCPLLSSPLLYIYIYYVSIAGQEEMAVREVVSSPGGRRCP
jgi:hypothetical protein